MAQRRKVASAKRMAARRKRREAVDLTELPVWPDTVVGGKYIETLQKELAKLQQADEAAHGNRRLFLDDVFVVYLLAFFNPTVRTLRTVEDFSQTRQVQKHLSITKLCRSTLSDFNQFADPQQLQPIIQVLREQLGRKQTPGRGGNQDDLASLLSRAIAVDGTFLSAAAEVAWAVECNNQRHARRHRARLDFQVAVMDWIPESVDVPEPGESESASAAKHVQDGWLYLYDRGFSGYNVINAHYREQDGKYEPRAHFVIRYKPAGGNSPALQDTQARPLSEKDRAAGVVSDQVGRFHSSKQSRHKVLDVPLREVIFEYQDGSETKQVRVITNLLDVSAAVIALLFRFRWQVELFFRWLKCFGNFDHLISHQREGVLLQFYVAVIATMLMYLHTGARPSKYLFVLLSQVACGAATLEEILPILRERERQCEKERQSAARRRAQKKAEGR